MVAQTTFEVKKWQEDVYKRQELKRVLSRLPEALAYDAAARTLALADPRWNSQPALYAALRLSLIHI